MAVTHHKVDLFRLFLYDVSLKRKPEAEYPLFERYARIGDLYYFM
jgi:hypothetical protein